MLPTFAFLTINQEWSFNIDFLGIVYKPWRLFLLICAIPNLICALVLMFVVPESPKFTYSQGDEAKTLRILRRMYRTNKGKLSQSFAEIAIIRNEEFGESFNSHSEGFFNFMWTQSVPLFKGKHLRNILTACFMQFAACNTTHRFWTFFPEFMNKISLWTENQNGPATICEIFTSTLFASNETSLSSQCIKKLEIGTFILTYKTMITYGVFYAILSLIINWTGKLPIVLVVAFGSATSAFLLMFIRLPVVASYLYIHMLLAGLNITLITASTVELFPTKMRVMAICISMMVGRLGSSIGSIFVGIFIDEHCTLTFLMPMILLLASGLVAMTIPNISKRTK
jgi:MFS transporter, VNT family, synaptic vesicle glycoprotein 2